MLSVSQTAVEVISKDEKSYLKTSRLLPRKSEKIAIMHLWNVTRALHNPNGICIKANMPLGHIKVVFS